jgi:hypothetical protein
MPQALPIENRERAFCASDGIYARQAAEYTKLLQTYDPDLIAKWLPDKFRWSIWTKDRRGHAYMVYECVSPTTKGFRHIGQVDITLIGKMDRQRKDKAYSILKEIDDNNDKLTEENKKELRNQVNDMARDRWRQFAGNPMIPVGISFRRTNG